MAKPPDASHDQPVTDPAVDPPAQDENGDVWLTDEQWVDDMNMQWRKVIDELMNGAKIYEAYAKAYSIDIEKPSQYNVAKSCGSRLLTNVNFRRLWDKVLQEHGFNDQVADVQLLDLMTNPGIDPKVRRAAIKDYNELRGRVVTKFDHTTKGEKLDNPYANLTTEQLRPLAEAKAGGDTSSDPA
jgi:hypothetical protein